MTPAMATPMPTTTTIRVASALMSGVTPSLTLLQIRIGRVVAPGPVVKLVITTSSSERVKASSQPERIAGAMIGRVTVRSTFHGREPRSVAASSSETSIETRRARTMVAT